VVREDTNHGGCEQGSLRGNVVREDTNHGGCEDTNHCAEMWFVKTRTIAAVKTRIMAAKCGS